MLILFVLCLCFFYSFHIFLIYFCFLSLVEFLSSFSSLFPFSVCVSFFVSSSRSLSLSPSTVSISFLTFLLLLGSLFIFDFFSFPLLLFLPSPISLFFSFPLWVFLLSPLVPLSRLLSRLFCYLSATLVFPFLPFSRNFSLPRSSPFLSLPLLLHFLLTLVCWSVLSPLCCVPLRCVSLSPFSPVSLLFLFLCLVSFFFFIFFLLSLFLSPPPLLPPFYFLDIFLFCFHGFILFLCLAPSAFFSSASLSRFPSVSFSFCFFLLLFLPLMSPLSVRLLFVLLLAFLPFLSS